MCFGMRETACYAAQVELYPALFLLAVVVGGSVLFGLVFGFTALWLTRDAQHGREVILAAGFLGFGMLPWLTAVVLLYFLMKAVHPFAGMKVAATALFVIPWFSATMFVARSIMRTRAGRE